MATTRALSTANINTTVDALPTFDEAAALTNRNLMYNGAMQVAQRGVTVAGINQSGSDTFLADRWATGMYNGPTGTFTMSVENDAPTGTGFRKSVKLLCTAGATITAPSIASLYQRFEGQDLQRIAKGTSSAKPLTLSFWVKSNVTGTYAIRFNDVNNSRIYVANYSVSASATWERKVISVAADTTGAFNNDNALSLVINFYLVAGSNSNSGTASSSWVTSGSEAAGMNVNVGAATSNYWQITGVQLEVGPVATPFEFKSFGQELRECQRYYFRHTTGGNAAGGRISAVARMGSSTSGQIVAHFPQLRTAPSAMDYSGVKISDDQTFDTAACTLTLNPERSSTAALIGVTTTGGGAGTGLTAFLAGASAYLGFSADL